MDRNLPPDSPRVSAKPFLPSGLRIDGASLPVLKLILLMSGFGFAAGFPVAVFEPPVAGRAGNDADDVGPDLAFQDILAPLIKSRAG
jgi:hypothetical protein